MTPNEDSQHPGALLQCSHIAVERCGYRALREERGVSCTSLGVFYWVRGSLLPRTPCGGGLQYFHRSLDTRKG
jgi:hypothetical protein